MARIRHKHSYEAEWQHHGEVNLLPSVTVPNEAFTLRDIMNRFVVGMDPAVTRNLIYDGDENYDDLDAEPLEPGELDPAELETVAMQDYRKATAGNDQFIRPEKIVDSRKSWRSSMRQEQRQDTTQINDSASTQTT